jgi:hypothetical protein
MRKSVMPKHGWKFRTERLREMSHQELIEYLRGSTSAAKLAKWVYKKLAPNDQPLQIMALEAIANDERIPWKHRWLWRELERQKANPLGDWVVIALTRWGVKTVSDVPRFIALYNDESAHPFTRGSAVFGLNRCLELAEMLEQDDGKRRLTDLEMEQIRVTCQAALNDETNPYARAGACWLASRFDCFEEELQRLSKDQTRIEASGGIVADYAAD